MFINYEENKIFRNFFILNFYKIKNNNNFLHKSNLFRKLRICLIK